MAERPRVGVIGSAVFAPRSPGNTPLEANADARMCRTGAGSAEAMKRIIGNALLPNVRKANERCAAT